MCGIIGIFNKENAVAQVTAALALLQNRGKDKVGITNGTTITHAKNPNELPLLSGKNCIGHALHAIVNHIPQPLQKENRFFVANCEIYNWQKLNQKYGFNAQNDAQLLFAFIQKFKLEKLDELDGVYAFAYWQDNTVYAARDLLGIKPLWFSHSKDDFVFASEKKALEKAGYLNVQELHPRTILEYDVNTNALKSSQQEFFTYLPEYTENKDTIQEKTQDLLDTAIAKRIPDAKFGLLFSGGIDSTYLAKYFKDQDKDFTCYTAVLQTDENQALPSDLLAAQEAAKKLGLNLKVKKIALDEIPTYLQKIVPLIEDSNVVKVGVALTFYLACEMAKEDGCKVVFSGLGSEEIFAGYERHKRSANINQECVSGLRKMFERDLYRDDVLTMDNNLELRLPFLDKNLIEYALKIPVKYKIAEIDGEIKTKKILRDIALTKEIPQEIALRKKTAAQYGSRFDHAIAKLAKREKFDSKSAYLEQFYPPRNLKLGLLCSSGKDSMYAAYIMQKQNYTISCLLTMKSENPHSYMFQSAGVEMAKLQGEAMGIPVLFQPTQGVKEEELEDLKELIKKGKEQFAIDGIITGAVMSVYQRDRIEKICDELGLKIFSPLWHKAPEQEMRELLQHNFKIIFTSVSADSLSEKWLGKVIGESEVEELIALQEKIGLHCNGEGGEFESLVLDCPLFDKKIEIIKSTKVMENEYTGVLEIQKAELKEK